MDDIEIKKILEDVLNEIDWKKQTRDWYIWEFEYKPMFVKIEFPKKNLTFSENSVECSHNKLMKDLLKKFEEKEKSDICII